MIQYLATRHGSGEILWARNVTFSVEQGQVFGIIGHNGAVNTEATAKAFFGSTGESVSPKLLRE